MMYPLDRRKGHRQYVPAMRAWYAIGPDPRHAPCHAWTRLPHRLWGRQLIGVAINEISLALRDTCLIPRGTIESDDVGSKAGDTKAMVRIAAPPDIKELAQARVEVEYPWYHEAFTQELARQEWL